jgi:xanthine/uracil/vitamin C permease (AzgA family)
VTFELFAVFCFCDCLQLFAFCVDGIAIVIGSLLGCAPLTVYIESASGEDDMLSSPAAAVDMKQLMPMPGAVCSIFGVVNGCKSS